MKDDPFSKLAGLDQRLFQQDERTKKTTKQRDNGRASARENEQNNAREHEPSNPSSNPPKNEPTRPQASPRTGHQTRLLERHSHDIFQDQVRWINRVKLDIEETYGQRVTGNQLVQLAIDLLRDDYNRKAEASQLVKQLVFRLLERERG